MRTTARADLLNDENSLSKELIKKINYLFMKDLCETAGQYRDGDRYASSMRAPPYEEIEQLLTSTLERLVGMWHKSTPAALAAYVLWSICHIHPFRDGNGRTARAFALYVFCLKYGRVLSEHEFNPEIIKDQDLYHNYISYLEYGNRNNLHPLQFFLEELIGNRIIGDSEAKTHETDLLAMFG